MTEALGIGPVVDARGHRCPTPTLRLRRALETALPSEPVTLVADDPMALIDVPHFVAEAGHALLSVAKHDGALRFVVRRGSSAAGADRASPPD